MNRAKTIEILREAVTDSQRRFKGRARFAAYQEVLDMLATLTAAPDEALGGPVTDAAGLRLAAAHAERNRQRARGLAAYGREQDDDS